jgi:hypothetical protein
MAKRFTDTTKFKKPFMRSLPKAYKLLWGFICDDCDNAGIWIVDFKAVRLYIGGGTNAEDAQRLFNADEVRIIPIDNGKKWFLPGFIEFQYGQLAPANRAHLSVITQLKKYDLLDTDLKLKKENKPPASPLQGAMDMDKDKELDKEKEKEGGVGGFDTPDIPGDDLTYPHSTAAFRTVWARWKVHSKRYAMYGEQSALDRLKGMSEPDAIAAINQAISSKWFNLYPDHSNGNSKFKTNESSKRTAANAITEPSPAGFGKL